MATIFYLHGFQSSGASQKGQWFKQTFGSEFRVVTPTYPQVSPSETVHFLQACLEPLLAENPDCVLAGASMGGFYVSYLAHQYDLPYLLINPALQPKKTLAAYLGQHQNPYTLEFFSLDQAYLEALTPYEVTLAPVEKALVLLDQGDEVIDYHFAQQLYLGRGEVVVFAGGDHGFQHLKEAESITRKFFVNSMDSTT